MSTLKRLMPFNAEQTVNILSEFGPLVLMFTCLLFIGTGAAFSGPATSALLPHSVPEQDFENAATWSSSSREISVMALILPETKRAPVGALSHLSPTGS